MLIMISSGPCPCPCPPAVPPPQHARTRAIRTDAARGAAATAALRRKKVTEQELERLQNTRFQLEMQINTLESASFNAETMAAMKKATTALKDIHGTLYVSTLSCGGLCLLTQPIVPSTRSMRLWRTSRSRPSSRRRSRKRSRAQHTLVRT